MSMKIYTRTGDKGKTSLLGGIKVPKSHIRIESYGHIDELNAFLGLLNDQADLPEIRDFVREIQDRLFTIGSVLASESNKKSSIKIPSLREEDITLLEEKIDAMEEELPPMKSFVLPGGHPLVSTAHVCRCICRRAERAIVAMVESGEETDPLILKYINRLSDYLFVLSRWLGRKFNAEELVWKPRI